MSERTCTRLLAVLVIWFLAASCWFASSELNSKRFWDERFSIGNVESVLVDRTLRPENGWYGRLSYLPQTAILAGVEALHRLTGLDWLAVFEPSGGFTPSAYLVARLVSVLYGAAALVLTFLIGRRIFSPPAALLGATLLACSPWALRHFVTFKPDALLLLLVLAAFYWSLDAAERPTARSFAVAGLGVGLAASAKFTGALVAIPVIAAALVATDRWRTVLQRLVVAGATSIAAFLLIQPDLPFYLHFLRRQDQIYSMKASHSFGSMLAAEAADLLHWSFHGPWIGSVALAGLAALCVQLARLLPAENSSWRVRHLAPFLSFPLGYSLVYALATNWPKGNNYLAIVPFTSLAAAWLLHALWVRAVERAPARARWPAPALALGGLVALAIWPANAYIYCSILPTTLDRAAERIRRVGPSLSARQALVESEAGALEVSSGGRSRLDLLMVREVNALTEMAAADLDFADFEMFPESRLDGASSAFYRQRIERFGGAAAAVLGPEWFRTVGPARVLLSHPWSRRGQPMVIEWLRQRPRKGRYAGRLPPGLRTGQAVSLEGRLPRHQKDLAGVRVGDLELPFLWNGWDEYGERFSTPRFALPAPDLVVRPLWTAGGEVERSPRLVVVRWAPANRVGESDDGSGRR